MLDNLYMKFMCFIAVFVTLSMYSICSLRFSVLKCSSSALKSTSSMFLSPVFVVV